MNANVLKFIAFFIIHSAFALLATACRFVEKPEVLILYFNETAPSQEEQANYHQIISWLKSDQNSASNKMAKILESDQIDYPKVVNDEINAFKSAIKNLPVDLHAVLFTNELARQGKFIILQSNKPFAHEQALTPLSSDNYIERSNPLSNEGFFKHALTKVIENFSPEKFRFMLITKTHGTETLAMMPRLRVRAEDTDREEVLKIAGLLNNEKKLDLRLPGRANKIGITKSAYFTILESFTRHGLEFEWLFMESCYGGLSGVLPAWQLPKNVKVLYANIGKSTKYSNLDYTKILAGVSSSRPTSVAIAEELDQKFSKINHSHNLFIATFSLLLAGALAVTALIIHLSKYRRLAINLRRQKQQPAH